MNKLLKFGLLVIMFSSPRISALEVGDIPEQETGKIQSRVKAKQFFALGIGPGRLLNMENTDTAYSLSGWYIWDVNPHAAVRAGVDALATFDSEAAAVLHGGIGANYYLLAQDISPLISLDLGMGGAVAHSKEVKDLFGFSGSVGAGIALFRTSDVQLQVLGRYGQLFKENEYGRPGYFALTINLLY